MLLCCTMHYNELQITNLAEQTCLDELSPNLEMCLLKIYHEPRQSGSCTKDIYQHVSLWKICTIRNQTV